MAYRGQLASSKTGTHFSENFRKNPKTIQLTIRKLHSACSIVGSIKRVFANF